MSPPRQRQHVSLWRYLSGEGGSSAASVVPDARPGAGALKGRVAESPLFRPFELERAGATLAVHDVDRKRSVRVVREALSRNDLWFTSGARDLAHRAATASLLQIGGIDGLDEPRADVGLRRVSSTLARLFRGPSAEKQRAWNILLLVIVARSGDGLTAAAAVRALNRGRQEAGLTAPAAAPDDAFVRLLAGMPSELQIKLIDCLGPLLTELGDARDYMATVKEREATYEAAIELANTESRDLTARLGEVQERLASADAQVSKLSDELGSLRIHAGQEVHVAKGELQTFLNGPIGILVEDALALLRLGSEHLPAVRENLEDIRGEIEQAREGSA